MQNAPNDKEKDFFRNRFDDFQSEPDDRVWAAIQQELPSQPPVSRFRRWKWLTGIMLILGATTGWLLTETDVLPIKETASEIKKSASFKKLSFGKSRPQTIADSLIILQSDSSPVAEKSVAETKENHSEKLHKNSIFSKDETSAVELPTAKKKRQLTSKSNQINSDETIQREQITPEALNTKTDAAFHQKFNLRNQAAKDKDMYQKSGFLTKKQSFSSSEGIATNKTEIIENNSENTENSVLAGENKNRKIVSSNLLKPLSASLLSTSVRSFQINTPVPPIQPPPPPTMRRWNITLGWMPFVHSYVITPIRTDSIWVENVQTGSLTQRWGWQAQVGFAYAFTSRLTVRASVIYNYSQMRLTYHTQSLYPVSRVFREMNNNSVSLEPIYETRTREWKQQRQIIGLRTDVLYHLRTQGKIKRYLLGGFHTTELSNFSSENYVQGGYGLSFPLHRRLRGWVEPTVHWSLNRYTSEWQDMQMRPYRVGVNVGVAF